MKTVLFIFISASIFFSCRKKHSFFNGILYKITQFNKIGYIDSSGKIIIPPIFNEAGDFSEGLANVRENGTYGYINTNGEYLIDSKFDFANPFSNGLALVFINGKPQFINKNGILEFQANYKQMTDFKYGVSIVKSYANRFGLINKKGKLILDTNYNNIIEFDDGYFGLNLVDNLKASSGVVDSFGCFILPLNENLGFCKVESKNNIIVTSIEDSLNTYNGSKLTLFDLKGNLLYQEDKNNNIDFNEITSCGRIKATFRKFWLENKKNHNYSNLEYEGFISVNGDIILKDTNIIETFDYSENKAVVITSNEDYYFVDLKGKKLKNKKFKEILEPGFENGLAIVNENGNYGIVDLNLNYIVEPVFEKINKIGRKGKYFIFIHKDTTLSFKKINDLYLFKETFNPESNEFINGILACKIDDLNAYVNLSGKVVWQEKPTLGLKTYNIDYKLSSNYVVLDLSDDSDIIESPFYNYFPKPKIIANSNKSLAGINIVVYPNELDTMIDSYVGFKLSIVNNTKKNMIFNNEDGRIHLVMQAKINKQWFDIQEYYNSWCGNSNGYNNLPNGYQLDLIAPKFKGVKEVLMRFKLTHYNFNTLKNKLITKDEIFQNSYKSSCTKYSKTFNGNINPAQVWRLAY